MRLLLPVPPPALAVLGPVPGRRKRFGVEEVPSAKPAAASAAASAARDDSGTTPATAAAPVGVVAVVVAAPAPAAVVPAAAAAAVADAGLAPRDPAAAPPAPTPPTPRAPPPETGGTRNGGPRSCLTGLHSTVVPGNTSTRSSCLTALSCGGAIGANPNAGDCQVAIVSAAAGRPIVATPSCAKTRSSADSSTLQWPCRLPQDLVAISGTSASLGPKTRNVAAAIGIPRW